MRRLTAALPLFLVLAPALLETAPVAAARLPYPETRRVEVVDDYHGTKVPDAYRWLEDDARTSKEVAAWVEAENAVTMPFLAGIPERDAIRRRLTELWNYERYSNPFKIAGRVYYLKNDGLQNQSVLYRAGAGSEAEMILDPNAWSKDGTVALATFSFSEDGRWLAYARSTSGSDWQEWSVRDLDAGADLPDRLQWSKFSPAAWTRDGAGFFYGRFAPPAPGAEFQALNRDMKVYYHRVGTPQSRDVLVYERPDHPEWNFGFKTTEDGRWLVISIWKGTDPKVRIVTRDLLEPYGMPIDLIDNFDNEYSFLGNDGSRFYFLTDLEAPRKRVIAIDLTRPGRAQWSEIIPQSGQPLEAVNMTGNLLIARSLKDVASQVRIFRLDGTPVREVELPGVGTALGFAGRNTDTETYYVYSSINTPPTIYRYDLISGTSTLWRQAKLAADVRDYVVRQVFFTSKDGTRVPMFIAHRRDVTPDGRRPTLLYGYGGFSNAMLPTFQVSRLGWMEMGGVYALVNLRGGSEYGEEWHQAGTKLRKQNVFDDFIAAAEYLIAQRYTSPARLAILGGSNGGLLVGAAMTQRPDLFGAALPAVGVMDMLRFHRFTAGRYWVDDYGSADDPEQFKALYAYSPYHRLKAGTKYPATLVTTADTDDRVVPGHSFKFAAALQAAQTGDAPVLIRIETRAGHGGGKPTDKIIQEVADQWAFLVKTLGFTLPAGYGGAASAPSVPK